MARARKHSFREASWISASFVAILFWVEIADMAFRFYAGMTLDGFGILPRTPSGLIGVFMSPLLHANWAHLMANAIPLLVLMVLLFWDRHYHPWWTFWSVWIVSGLGTWLIGRSGTVHIGASSIIFGLVTYLITCGFLLRTWRSAFVALLVFLAFGGIFYGILPQRGLVSWEGHLCGAIAGALAAFFNHDQKPRRT